MTCRLVLQKESTAKYDKVLLDAPCSGLGVLSKVALLIKFTFFENFAITERCTDPNLELQVGKFCDELKSPFLFPRGQTCVGIGNLKIWRSWCVCKMSSLIRRHCEILAVTSF